MSRILVIHGPNLNLLGQREPTIYGNQTLADINSELVDTAKKAGIELRCFQSNAEHEIVEKIQSTTAEGFDFIIINPAAFTHTSISIRDALLAVHVPFYEVHLSNIYAREPFRQHSYFADIAQGIISGLGPKGYMAALEAIIAQLS
ncbi:MAG TPA: type II 3-dehydroquinate dehydratase [Gammaproteobacteria bacterium]|nr:type II 3-dehydroquinate dehydratase [Gammaproteobacteria bacterium]